MNYLDKLVRHDVNYSHGMDDEAAERSRRAGAASQDSGGESGSDDGKIHHRRDPREVSEVAEEVSAPNPCWKHGPEAKQRACQGGCDV